MNGYGSFGYSPGLRLGQSLYSMSMMGQTPKWFLDYIYSYRPQNWQMGSLQQSNPYSFATITGTPGQNNTTNQIPTGGTTQ